MRIRFYILNLICFSGLLIGLMHDSHAEMIQNIKIYGNRHFTRDVVLENLGIGEEQDLPLTWPDKELENLFSFYHKQGFYYVKLDSMKTRILTDTNYVDLSFWLYEGKQIKTGSVILKGLESFEKRDIDRFIETRPGTFFNEQVLENDIDNILTYFENRGYPLCKVKIRSLKPDREEIFRMNVTLFVTKDSLVTLHQIDIKGNKLTKEKVILRETRLKTNSIYKHKDILSSLFVLRKLEFLDEVSEPEILFLKDRAIVTFQVKEGNANTFDGVIGYNPPKQERDIGYFTGRLQFMFQNLLGTGRFLEAYWEKKDEFTQTMRFGYEEPWLLGFPLNLGTRFSQEIRDTTYVEREWRFFLNYKPWPSLSINLETGPKAILPDSLSSRLLNLAETRSWLFSAGFDYNTLDNVINPTRGFYYHTDFTLGRKRNLGPDFLIEQEGWKSEINTRKIKIDAESAFLLFNRQVLYLGLHGTEFKSGERFVPISDQIRFGGANTVRGYREDAFNGTMVAWLNVEYRYLLGKNSRAFIFMDVGMYERRDRDLGMVRGTKTGYGFGIRLETRLGLMGIAYGMGEGDGFLQGKVHVGLVNRF
jgi:outer membrane protein assembly factor BamA